MKHSKSQLKRFEVSVTEINHGFVLVEARSLDEARLIAQNKCMKGMAIMEETPSIETRKIKEVLPMGFRINH